MIGLCRWTPTFLTDIYVIIYVVLVAVAGERRERRGGTPELKVGPQNSLAGAHVFSSGILCKVLLFTV